MRKKVDIYLSYPTVDEYTTPLTNYVSNTLLEDYRVYDKFILKIEDRNFCGVIGSGTVGSL